MTHEALAFEKSKAVTYKKIDVSSAAFKENHFIPRQYTCEGININPSLNFLHIPKEAQSLAIIAEDPDAPSGTWVHWLMWNIPVIHHLKENSSPGIQGMNDFSKHIYCGPCPPKGTHRYFFKIYALDCILDLPVSSNKIHLEKAMSGHIIGFGELIGLYKRK